MGCFWLYAFCIMPDHVHALMRMRNGQRHLSTIIAGIKIATMRRLQGLRWQRGFHESIIRPWEDCNDVVRYILMNPVRAGLVKDPSLYPHMGVVDSCR